MIGEEPNGLKPELAAAQTDERIGLFACDERGLT